MSSSEIKHAIKINDDGGVALTTTTTSVETKTARFKSITSAAQEIGRSRLVLRFNTWIAGYGITAWNSVNFLIDAQKTIAHLNFDGTNFSQSILLGGLGVLFASVGRNAIADTYKQEKAINEYIESKNPSLETKFAELETQSPD